MKCLGTVFAWMMLPSKIRLSSGRQSSRLVGSYYLVMGYYLLLIYKVILSTSGHLKKYSKKGAGPKVCIIHVGGRTSRCDPAEQKHTWKTSSGVSLWASTHTYTHTHQPPVSALRTPPCVCERDRVCLTFSFFVCVCWIFNPFHPNNSKREPHSFILSSLLVSLGRKPWQTRRPTCGWSCRSSASPWRSSSSSSLAR